MADGTLTLTGTRYAGRLVQSAHAHDHDQLSLLVAGTLIEASGVGEATCGPATVMFKEAGFRHADTFGAGGALVVQVQVAGGSLRDHLDPGRDLGPWAQWGAPEATGPFLARAGAARCRHSPAT